MYQNVVEITCEGKMHARVDSCENEYYDFTSKINCATSPILGWSARRLAYYIRRIEYQTMLLSTKPTDATGARIKVIGKTCRRPRLRFLCRLDPLLSRAWHFSCLTFAWSTHLIRRGRTLLRLPSSATRAFVVFNGWCALKAAGVGSRPPGGLLAFRHRLNDDISVCRDNSRGDVISDFCRVLMTHPFNHNSNRSNWYKFRHKCSSDKIAKSMRKCLEIKVMRYSCFFFLAMRACFPSFFLISFYFSYVAALLCSGKRSHFSRVSASPLSSPQFQFHFVAATGSILFP